MHHAIKSPIGAVAVLAVLFTSLGMPTAEAKFVSCRKVYLNNYAGKPGHKAMATSAGQKPSGSYEMSCGWAFDQRSVWQAKRLALRNCKIADKNHKNKGDCKIVFAE